MLPRDEVLDALDKFLVGLGGEDHLGYPAAGGTWARPAILTEFTDLLHDDGRLVNAVPRTFAFDRGRGTSINAEFVIHHGATDAVSNKGVPIGNDDALQALLDHVREVDAEQTGNFCQFKFM